MALHSHQLFKRLDAWTYENHSRLRFCLHNFFGYLCAEDPHYQAILVGTASKDQLFYPCSFGQLGTAIIDNISSVDK